MLTQILNRMQKLFNSLYITNSLCFFSVHSEVAFQCRNKSVRCEFTILPLILTDLCICTPAGLEIHNFRDYANIIANRFMKKLFYAIQEHISELVRRNGLSVGYDCFSLWAQHCNNF